MLPIFYVVSENMGLFRCLGEGFGGITLGRGIEVAIMRAVHGAHMLATLRVEGRLHTGCPMVLLQPHLIADLPALSSGSCVLTLGPLRCSVQLVSATREPRKHFCNWGTPVCLLV